MTEEAEFVTIARVAKTQGRHGEVAATVLTDFPELFETRRKLFALGDSRKQGSADNVARRQLELDEHWFHKGMVVLKFAAWIPSTMRKRWWEARSRFRAANGLL